MKKTKTITIIGSGFSALAASCYLAKDGFEVTILEKNSTVGGRARQLSKEGFIAELKRAYRLCQYAPEPSTPEPESETSSNLIIKVTQTPQAWLPDTKILREWHRDLTALIDGFRNEMVEF